MATGLIRDCRKQDCPQFATLVVKKPGAPEDDGFWVCTRHVNWALGWIARRATDWKAEVVITAWDRRRQ